MAPLALAKTLKLLVDREKITLRRLAKETGVPQPTLSGYLAGACSAKPNHILSLSKYFGVSMEYILFGLQSEHQCLGNCSKSGTFEGWMRVKIEQMHTDIK